MGDVGYTRHRRARTCAAVVALTFVGPIAEAVGAPGQATQSAQPPGVGIQDERSVAAQQKILDEFSRSLEQLEAAQARGNCAEYREIVDQLTSMGLLDIPFPQNLNRERHFEDLFRMEALDDRVGREVVAPLRRRFAQIRARGCPPQQAPGQPSPTQPEPVEDILQEAPIPNTLIEAGGAAPDEPLQDVGGEVGVELDLESWQFELPITGIGFRRDGPAGATPERLAGTTVRRVSPKGGRARLVIDPVRLGFHYAEGTGRTSYDVPGGGDIFDIVQFNSGIVYGALSPGGNSGTVTPFGVSGTTEVDLRTFSVMVDTPLVEDVPDPSKDGLTYSFTLRAYGEVERRDIDYQSTAAGAGTVRGFLLEFSQLRNQALRDTFTGAGLLGESIVHFGPPDEFGVGAIALQLDVLGGIYRMNSQLDSREHNRCNYCQTPDQDFTVNIRGESAGWGFAGEAGVTAEFRLSPSFSIVTRGATDYRSDVGAIFNPHSGDQVFFEGMTTGLRTEDSFSWSMGAGVVIRLGGR